MKIRTVYSIMFEKEIFIADQFADEFDYSAATYDFHGNKIDDLKLPDFDGAICETILGSDMASCFDNLRRNYRLQPTNRLFEFVTTSDELIVFEITGIYNNWPLKYPHDERQCHWASGGHEDPLFGWFFPEEGKLSLNSDRYAPMDAFNWDERDKEVGAVLDVSVSVNLRSAHELTKKLSKISRMMNRATMEFVCDRQTGSVYFLLDD